jgi:hypothetical protein
MNAIRIRRKIDSETIHIPELETMIGREVEIIVLEEKASPLSGVDTQAFWTKKTAEELAVEQSVGIYKFDDPNRHIFSEDDFEGFEATLREWRKE